MYINILNIVHNVQFLVGQIQWQPKSIQLKKSDSNLWQHFSTEIDNLMGKIHFGLVYQSVVKFHRIWNWQIVVIEFDIVETT